MAMAFGLFEPTPVPPPAGEFPTGPQFQQDNVNVGPANPTNVSFNGDGVMATYDEATDTVNVGIAGASTSGGNGGGTTATLAQGEFQILSAGDTLDLVAFGFTSTDEQDYWVWAKGPSQNCYFPVLPSSNIANDSNLATFSFVGGVMQFANLSGFSEGGSIVVRQIG